MPLRPALVLLLSLEAASGGTSADAVQMGTPLRVDGRSEGTFWFPNTITTMGNGVIILRVSVHADVTTSLNEAAIYTSIDNGESFQLQTPGCEAKKPCKLHWTDAKGQKHAYGPTRSWELSIPQADGSGLLAIPYQPLFANPSHTSLVWRATRLTVSKTGAVSVVGVGDDINVTLTGLPRAINGTYTDTTDDSLPNANLYSGAGVELASGGGRVALLTNVRWAECARWPYTMNASNPSAPTPHPRPTHSHPRPTGRRSAH